jgi:hypothetical protein
MRSEPASALFTTATTESELLYGIALLPEGRRRQFLEAVVDLISRRISRVVYCPSTVRQLVNSQTSPRAGVAPGGLFPKPTRASPPSPGLVAPPWRSEKRGF